MKANPRKPDKYDLLRLRLFDVISKRNDQMKLEPLINYAALERQCDEIFLPGKSHPTPSERLITGLIYRTFVNVVSEEAAVAGCVEQLYRREFPQFLWLFGRDGLR